jgi:hypothetical protein
MFLFQKPFLGLVWHGSEALPFAEEGEEQYKTHFRRGTVFLVNSKGVGAFFLSREGAAICGSSSIAPTH